MTCVFTRPMLMSLSAKGVINVCIHELRERDSLLREEEDGGEI